MMAKVALLISYDGTGFRGWTDVRDAAVRPTLSRLLQHELLLEAASRTDAGVHARGNVATFSTAAGRDLSQLTYSLNQLLPSEICVQCAAWVDTTFDVRNNRGKEYRYVVKFCGAARDPLQRLYEWQLPPRRGRPEWDGAAAARAAAMMRGHHSFGAFGNTPRGKERLAPVDVACHLQMIQLRQVAGNAVMFRLRGDRFLYKMVRNIVGALVRVGLGELGEEEVADALARGAFERSMSVPLTAPAHGLVLHKVLYPKGEGPFDYDPQDGQLLRLPANEGAPRVAPPAHGPQGLRPWRTRVIRMAGGVGTRCLARSF